MGAARVPMTCTSGPGISLMSEFVGLGYFAEIPAVIIDVQRVGPSTGLPTRTMQGDMLTNAIALARRHQASGAAAVIAERVLHHGAEMRSIWPSSSRRRCLSIRISISG